MALIKRVLLFFLSLVGIIVLLIGATTSYAQDNYEADTLEPNFRFYSIKWLDIPDKEGGKYVCGTKVTTYDYTGRKYNIEYYYLLTSDDEIITQFIVNAVQMSVDNPETRKMEQLEIKLYASVLSLDFACALRFFDDFEAGDRRSSIITISTPPPASLSEVSEDMCESRAPGEREGWLLSQRCSMSSRAPLSGGVGSRPATPDASCELPTGVSGSSLG